MCWAEGGLLGASYFAFIVVSWRIELQPHELGETAELDSEAVVATLPPEVASAAMAGSRCSAAIQRSSWRFLPFERNGPRFCTRGAVRRSCSRLESAQSKQLDRNVS